MRKGVFRDMTPCIMVNGTFIKLQRLRWFGFLQRIDDARNTKKVYQANLHHKQPKGRPKPGWKDNVENIIRNMGIVNWRQVARDRD
jgi:hypothetical protein